MTIFSSMREATPEGRSNIKIKMQKIPKISRSGFLLQNNSEPEGGETANPYKVLVT